jgi:hypothetical protein
VRERWLGVTGVAPTGSQINSLFRLIHVAICDVEPLGSDERGAIDQLAGTILARSEQASTCWAKLLEIAANLSQQRAGHFRPRSPFLGAFPHG